MGVSEGDSVIRVGVAVGDGVALVGDWVGDGVATLQEHTEVARSRTESHEEPSSILPSVASSNSSWHVFCPKTGTKTIASGLLMYSSSLSQIGHTKRSLAEL